MLPALFNMSKVASSEKHTKGRPKPTCEIRKKKKKPNTFIRLSHPVMNVTLANCVVNSY